MASVLTAPPPAPANDGSLAQNSQTARRPASLASRSIPAKLLVRMGRAATVGEGINWLTLAVIVAVSCGRAGGAVLLQLAAAGWSWLVLYVLAINVGIGMCYHRLLTHRGYHVPKWLEYVDDASAPRSSLEGGPIFWVSTHRVHHQLSDQEGDPHTPREGGWWAHTGWILFGEALHAQTEVSGRYSPDLSRDRFHVWLSKYHWLPLTASGVLLFGRRLALGRLGERRRHGAVGRSAARHPRPARHLAGELGHAPVGQPAL